jgi:ABC-type bacteriocin/lantibiotic exporter with double-glycine peptidase domain
MTTPTLTFIQAILAVIQCLSCLDRIQEYASVLNQHDKEETPDENITGTKDSSFLLQVIPKSAAEERELVKFSNYSVGWKKDTSPVLREIQLNIQRGAITMIVGPIGSGKLTPLERTLGETVGIGEIKERIFSYAAYCSQTPCLQRGSIRQNIIGASAIDIEYYTKVVSACGLDTDLVRLPERDHTLLGNNGLTISGGQKQRIVGGRCILHERLNLIHKPGISSSPVLAIQSGLVGRRFQRH